MAKTKLSISLVKEGIPIERVVKGGIPYLSLQNGLRLYYKNNLVNHQYSVRLVD